MAAESKLSGTTRPVVRVALGMDPAEVVTQSSYPLDFSSVGQPFADPAFRYGNLIITANINLEILKPHHLVIEDVLFWDILTQFDDVESFGARARLLTLDEALDRAKKWMAVVDGSGWIKGTDVTDSFYSWVERKKFANMNAVRTAFLLPGNQKIIGCTIGVWFSLDKTQEITISLERKREDGGPRYPSTPDSPDPLIERSYLLSISVGYSDATREYRNSKKMERRSEALTRKGLTDKNGL